MLTAALLLLAASPQTTASPIESPEAQPSNERRPLEAMDIFQLEGVDAPRVSPDGTRVLYLRTSFDVMSDSGSPDLWIYNAENHDNRPLIAGVGGAQWSPDGHHIAYVKLAGKDGAEIFVRWMDDGTTHQVTHAAKSPSSIAWSPDGKRIAFTMGVEREATPLAKLPSAPKGARWAPAPKVIERFSYRRDGQGYKENTDTHIFVVDAFGGTPRQVTSGEHDHSGPLTWIDEHTLVFSGNLREDRHDHPSDTDVHALDVNTGVLTKLTNREGPDSGAVFDPDTSALYWLGYDDRRQGHQQLEISRRASGLDPEAEVTVLSEDLDRSPSGLKFAEGKLWFTYADEGVTKLGVASEGGLETSTHTLHGMGAGRPYTGGSFDAAGGTLAYVGGDPAWPGELLVQRNGEFTQVTDVNGDLRRTVKLGAVTEQWTETAVDGQRIQSWTITPPDFEPGRTGEDGQPLQYPMLLEIHGGPFAAYGPHFSFELQLFASMGYVVVYGNPRGSTSYGESFANMIHHAYPSEDYDDLMGMVDSAIAGGQIDEDQLYVTGGSGGGVLTAWIVGQTDRFTAAVVAKPVINWTSFVLTSDAYDFFWQYWFAKAPWEAPEQYWERSPLSLVGNVTTPTMLLTGESDYRTPISESEQYYQALKIRGVETAFVRVPGAGHGIARRPSNLLAKVLLIDGWFSRYPPRDDADESEEAPESGGK